ncbi:MAG: tetratricopeptide repeat protein [Pararhodobacter sp.]|nr:tetratricopeptide repeat protein [Pararhodobacter sp.]
MPHAKRLSPFLLAAALSLSPTMAAPQGQAGAYLAAREAGVRSDFAAGIPYLSRLLAAEPDNPAFLETLVISHMALGQIEEATEKAAQLFAIEPESHIAGMALLGDAFQSRDYATALSLLENGGGGHVLVEGLARAWAHLGDGRMTEALAVLDTVAGRDGMGPFALYCRALALAMVGDVEGALEIFEDPTLGVSEALDRRGIIAHAQVLALAERPDDALALIDMVFVDPGRDPQLAQMREAYAAGEALPFDLIADPAEGMAEVFSVMARAMQSGRNLHDALLFARAAILVNPALSEQQLLVGQILEELDQPLLAAQAYAEIPEDSIFALPAAMGRAHTLETLERIDEAIDVLQALAAENPQSVSAFQVLGDFLRRDARHEEAIIAYDRALELHQEQERRPDWRLWFSRAVSYERSGQWEPAEADFRRALEIEPDQPTVLNYLGYSLVERQENLDEALEMIERAVAGEPDSGYIIDSLAWALYRMGRYDEALPHMERAVELLPADPILNDHLGDVYWALGRYREARFQWRRALSFGPHEDLDMDRVRRKIDIGLDRVLDEEGAPPLHPEG